MQIKRLEDTVGAPVLIRDRGRVRATAQGEVLARYARQIVDLHDSAMHALSPTRSRTTLRVGTPADYATGFLATVIPAFARANPDIDLEVRCDLSNVLLDALDRGQLDLAIVTREPEAEPRGRLPRESPLSGVGHGMVMPTRNDQSRLRRFRPAACSAGLHPKLSTTCLDRFV